MSNAWRIAENGLSVSTIITNRSDTAAPVAAGFHPYVQVGTTSIDDAMLTVPAQTRMLVDQQQIPIGTEPVAGSAFDFREPRQIGNLHIDHAFTDLRRDSDGRCRLRLTDARGGSGMTLWADEAYPYFEIFTGDTLLDASRRRRGLALEPMSAPPNALVTGESLVVLEPAERWIGTWGIDPD